MLWALSGGGEFRIRGDPYPEVFGGSKNIPPPPPSFPVEVREPSLSLNLWFLNIAEVLFSGDKLPPLHASATAL